jgi:3-hydroxyacyl-[acyl-carrier-protein] dehydratase
MNKGVAMELDTERLLRILSQKPLFLFLDRVIELAPRKSARGVKCITANEPCFHGQVGPLVFPGTLIIEAMSQLFSVLAYASEPFDTNQKVLFLLGFDGAKFRRPAVPGDRLNIDIEITHRRSNIWKAHAIATVDDNLCARADLLAALTNRGELPYQ